MLEYLRPYTEEDRQRDLHKVAKFRFSPNKEADFIEECIGIKYTEKPRKIPLTFANRIRMILNSALRRQFRHVLFQSKQGQYSTALNIYVANQVGKNEQEVQDRIDYHENGHGLIAQINPQVFGFGGTHKNGLFGLEEGFSQFAIQYTDEGLAEWIAAECIGHKQYSKRPDRIREYHEEYAKKYHIGTSDLMFNERYRLGYKLVNYTMKELAASGIPMSDSLVLITRNPANRWEYFGDATPYIQSLLKLT